MKTKILSVLLLIGVLVSNVTNISVFAEIGMTSTAEAPANHEPIIYDGNSTEQQISLMGTDYDANVMLIQDNLPWDSYANSTVLSNLANYEIVHSYDVMNKKLSNYDVIIVANDQTQSTYSNYLSYKLSMEEYIKNGGVVVFGACDSGWSQGVLEYTLPGNVTKAYYYDYNNYISNYNHPIVTGELTDNNALVNSDLNHNACSHTYFLESTLPDNSNIILRGSSTNEPTLVEYSLGKGTVIASGLTWEHAYDHSGAFGKAIDDLYAYAINLSLGIDFSSSTSKGAPIINSAVLTRSGKTYDIFNTVVNIEKDSDISTDLIVSVDNNGCKNVEIYLTQGTTTSEEISNNSATSLKLGKIFTPNKDIYLLAVDTATGKSTSKKTRLRVVQGADGEWLPSSGTDGLNFKLGKDTGFTIPDSVPVVGGTDINWSFDFIPVSVEYDRADNNKINVVFGTSIISEKTKKTVNGKEVETTYFKDFDFSEYKKDFKKAASKQGRTLKQLKNDFKMTNINKMSLFGGNVLAGGSGSKSGDLSVAGYAEIKYVDGKWVFAEGQLALEAEISYTYQGQLFIWVVPCYYEFGGEVGAGIEGIMTNISPETFEPVFNAYLKAHLGANIGGGIGIAKVATVGASGAANFNIKTALHKEYLKSWVDGSANINVKVFGKEVAKKEFAKGEYLLYETGNNSGLIKDGGIMLMTANDMIDDISINAVYENESRNYANNATNWYGDDEKISLMAIDFSNKNLNILAENIYTESAPQICNVNGTKVMVMQWDNPERSAIDRTELRYSVYDDIAAKWSEPVAVYDDGTADFYPCFKDGYLVWQNQKTQLTDEMTLTDIAALGEICVSKWNGTGFNTPITLTNNDILETIPYIAVNGENVQILWVTNSENDITGISGTNSIVASNLEGVTHILKSDLGAISAISAGYIDDKFAVAYVADEDNNLKTIEDRDITVIYNGNTIKLTNNDILDSNPVFVGDKIYYYSNSNIVYTDITGSNSQTIFDEATMGVTDNFAISQNSDGDVAVYWTKADATGTNIYTAFNDGSEWNKDIAITSLENQAKYPSGILNDDGTMLVAFNYGILENNEIIQTDLYTVELTPAYDIEIVNSYIDEETMTIYATVKNVGELPINGFELSVSDNGIINNSISSTDVLKPNDTTEVEFVYNKPENMSLRTLELIAAISEDEYNTDNNLLSFMVGNADISVENIDIIEGGVYTITADISNIGYNNADKITVSLREDGVNGEVLDSQVMSLAVGGTESVRFELSPDEIKFVDNRKQYFVTAEATCDEITSGNNDGNVFAVLYEVDDYEISILNYSYADKQLTVNAFAKNNTNDVLTADAVFAVYSSDGRMKGITTQPLSVGSYSDTGIDIWFESYTYASGDYVKMFMWSGLTNLKPLVNAEVVKMVIE